MTEGILIQWKDERPVEVPISQLHPRTRARLHSEAVARRERALYLMGKQGGLANVLLVIKGVQIGEAA